MISSFEIGSDGFTGKISFGENVKIGKKRFTQTEISWKFENESCCCERYGVIFDDCSYKLVGKTIDKFDLIQTSLVVDRTIHNIKGIDFQNGYTFDLVYILKFDFTDGSSWSIIFYNEHNGYYDHNLDIFENGKIKWNVTI